MKKPWSHYGDDFGGWLTWMETENVNLSNMTPYQSYKLYRLMSYPYEEQPNDLP